LGSTAEKVTIIAHSTHHDSHSDIKSRFPTRNGSAIDVHEEGNSPVRFPIHFGIYEPKISQSKNVGLFRSVFVDQLPGKTPGAIILMEFNRHDHLSFAVLAVPSVFVCSVQQDLWSNSKTFDSCGSSGKGS
jgi:hypothetical protein